MVTWKDEIEGLKTTGAQFIKWLLWEFSGIRFLCEHVRPPTEGEKKDKRPPSTIGFWFTGVYLAIYGVAWERYESHIDRLELRASSVVALLGNDNVRPEACAQIALLQTRKVPMEPQFGDPVFWLTFFKRYEEPYLEVTKLLKRAVESSKKHLSGANLNGANLSGADLSEGNLSGAELSKANLSDTNLFKTRLIGSMFHEVNLSGAVLIQANLSNSILNWSDLTHADLSGANLIGTTITIVDLINTDFSGANLSGATLSYLDLTRTHMGSVTLIGADLDGVNLTGMDLSYADLTGANLTRGVLTGANLAGADMSGVRFYRNNIKGANLADVDLTGICGWRTIRSFEDTNIHGIKNVPVGFREFARSRGAIEDPLWEKREQGQPSN